MHRRGGKRIRLDDPPPEYDNPMTPQVDPDAYGANYNPYGESSYAEQAGTSGASSDGMFESPPTPGMGRRITRARARGITNPPPLPMSYSPPPEKPGRGRGRGRPPGRKNNVTHVDLQFRPDSDDDSLYNVIKSGRVCLTNVVDDWIESYKVIFSIMCFMFKFNRKLFL